METILKAIEQAGGRPLRVGGCVRDELLGINSKDVDVEVYGLPYERLVEVLKQFGRVFTVGKSFGVIKLTHNGEDFDFSLPRRDNKVGAGHKGFDVEPDHNLTPAEAALRRDFTINAMGRDNDGKLIDPYNGKADLETRILRATSEHFAEDPLRVIRGMQFAARFEMTVERQTAEMCRGLKSEFDTIASERIWGEFEKFALKCRKPSMGIRFLIETGWLELFPDLHRMLDSPQDEIWHPEGCVLTHTMHCMDAAVEVADREGIEGEDRVVLILSVLCHDIGKPDTLSTNDDGRYINHGHAEQGVPVAKRFLKQIGAFPRIVERVLPLVKFHMVHTSMSEEHITPRFVRRLARNLGKSNIRELAMVMESDHSGRPPLEKGMNPLTQRILDVAEQVSVQDSMPQPIVRGRDLIERFQVKGGPNFKIVLDAAYEAQLNGEFDSVNSGLEYIVDAGLSTQLS